MPIFLLSPRTQLILQPSVCKNKNQFKPRFLSFDTSESEKQIFVAHPGLIYLPPLSLRAQSEFSCWPWLPYRWLYHPHARNWPHPLYQTPVIFQPSCFYAMYWYALRFFWNSSHASRASTWANEQSWKGHKAIRAKALSRLYQSWFYCAKSLEKDLLPDTQDAVHPPSGIVSKNIMTLP